MRFPPAFAIATAMLALLLTRERLPAQVATDPYDLPELPEVLIQPDEPPLPQVDVQPDTDQPTDPYDLPQLYPSLSQRAFDSLGGALRSRTNLFDDPRLSTIIDPQELAERTPMNMAQALEREVSVLVQSTGAGQASPFIRGLTGPQTLILIDGIRLNNSTFRFGPNQYFATIDPGIVERIEVVRGPQSVLWGSDAIGGVINVVTRSAPGLGYYYDYTTGSLVQRVRTADLSSYTRMNVEATIGRAGVFGGGGYLNVRNIDRGGGLGRQPFTDYSQYAGDVKLDYLLDNCQLLTVALQHHEQQDVPRTDQFPGQSRVFDPQQRDLGYIRWQGTSCCGLFDAFMVTASAQRQKEGTLRRRPPTATIEDRGEFSVETTGVNVLFARDLQCLGRLTYGVDWYHDDVDAANQRVDLLGGTVTPRTPQFPPDSFYERAGGFLQWEVDLAPRLSATTGARYSAIDLGATVALFDPASPNFPNDPPVDTPISPHFQDWTGTVGLVWRLTDCVHLVGSVSEGFRAPSLDELTAVSGNVNEGVDLPTINLTAETSINYEVGLKFDHQRLRGQAMVYWTDLDGLIDRILVGTDDGGTPADTSDDVDFFQRQNIGTARVRGLDLAGEVLLTPEWSVYGNFWYTYGLNVTGAEPLSRIPPAQGVIGLRRRDECGWLDVYAWLVRDQDRLSARDARDSRIPTGGTPGYGTVNFRAGRYLGEHHRVSVVVENLFDRLYRVHGSGVDGPGISAAFGYEYYH